MFRGKHLPWLLGALACAALGVAIWQEQRHLDANDLAQRRALAAECYRVNVLRASLNTGRFQLITAFRLAAQNAPALRRASLYYARASPFNPLTNCREALKHPVTYVPPAPQAFPTNFTPQRVPLPIRNP